jgi:SAM-dependent methyltransferase
MIILRYIKRLIKSKIENLVHGYIKKQEEEFNLKLQFFLNRLESSIEVLQQEVEKFKSESARKTSEFNGRISDIYACLNLISRNLEGNFKSFVATPPKLNSDALNYDEQLIELERLEPTAYPLWRECFELGKAEYRFTELNNLSTADHRIATGFEDFIEKYAYGNLLDVGCGPQLIPSYLRKLISNGTVDIYGVEPITSSHPFPCYKGFAEFLPWAAESFDVVVCATSLDHCLSLDRTLREIYRTLKIDGVFLLWVGFVAGSVEYDPKNPLIKKIDPYHLFHFDRPWLDLILERYSFSLLELVNFDEQSHFYALRKLSGK